VLLGWHYFADGLVGSIGVFALWKLAPALLANPQLLAVKPGLPAIRAQ
jgi:hypothetical protein